MIRFATKEDSSDIAALSIQVWLDNYATDGIKKSISQYVLNEFTEASIEGKIKDESSQYILAVKDNHLIGFALINLSSICPITSHKIPELDQLYVQENFTSQGVGSELLNAAIKYCSEINHKNLWLTVWFKNQRALQFYKKHKFIDIGATYFDLDNEKHENRVLSISTL